MNAKTRHGARLAAIAAALLLAAACGDAGGVSGPGTQVGSVIRPLTWVQDSATVPDNASYQDMSGSSPTDIIAVGSVISRYSGRYWRQMASPAHAGLLGVWAAAPGDAFAVGVNGVILRLQGDTWTQMASPVNLRLYDVWGTSSTNVFAVGERGVILRYDGVQWTRVRIGVEPTLLAVHGTGPGNVLIVGDDGLIVQFDGANFNLYRTGGEGFIGVLAPDAASAYVLSTTTLLRSTGGSFEPVTVPGKQATGEFWQSIAGSSSNDVWLVSDQARYHFDGATWTRTAFTGASSISIRNMHPTGGNRAFLVGQFEGRNHLLEDDGTGALAPVFGTPGATYLGAWGFSATDVYAASNRGVWRYDGSRWARLGSSGHVSRIWGSAPENLFAVSANGRILRYDGSAWAQSWPAAGNPALPIYNIHGWSATDAMAVGLNGQTLRWNGTAWQPMTSGTSQPLADVWGAGPSDVFAVGGNGTVRRWDGTAWSGMTSATANHLHAVWGSSPSDVFAVGNWGTIVHWNGTAWSVMPSATLAHLADVWGAGPSDVFAVGTNGSIVHYDGTSWKDVSPANLNNLRAVWVPDAMTAFAVGDSSTILYNR